MLTVHVTGTRFKFELRTGYQFNQLRRRPEYQTQLIYSRRRVEPLQAPGGQHDDQELSESLPAQFSLLPMGEGAGMRV